MFIEQVKPNVSEIYMNIGLKSNGDVICPEHLHTDLEFLQIAEGDFTVRTESETIEAKAGDIILINRNVPHSTKCRSETRYNLFQIDIEKFISGTNKKLMHLSAFLNENKNPVIVFGRNTDTAKEIDKCLCDMINEQLEKKPYYDIMIKSAVYRLIGILYRNEILDDYFSKLNKTKLESLMPALQYIDEHYTEEITLEGISGSVHLNMQYFSRLFKKITDRNVSDYIMYLRVCRAQNLLLQTEKTILEISYNSGYSSISNFNKSFRKVTGCTPSKYRKIKTEGI